VLVLDETGVVHQGRHAAGVARQDRCTVGPVAHGPSGVWRGEARPLGPAWRDRERARPTEGTDAPEPGRQAGMPQDRPGATTPPLAPQRLGRACAAGVAAPGGTGARVDGAARRLRPWWAAHPQADVLAVTGQAAVWRGGPPRQVTTRLAAPREPGWRRGRLVRRRVSAPPELTASVVFARQATTLEEVVRVAGSRWTIESRVEEATGAVGLAHDDVRRGTGW
jgi:hypothetical protein